jgi:hypothetical protein
VRKAIADGDVDLLREGVRAIAQYPVAMMVFLNPGVERAFFNGAGGRYDPSQTAAGCTDVLAGLREELCR